MESEEEGEGEDQTMEEEEGEKTTTGVDNIREMLDEIEEQVAMRFTWVKNQDPDPGSGSGMNIPNHISESLGTIFWVKIL